MKSPYPHPLLDGAVAITPPLEGRPNCYEIPSAMIALYFWRRAEAARREMEERQIPR